MGGDSVYYTTVNAQMGDMGSKLPPTNGTLPKWVAGSDVQVAWGMRFNHGGGYQVSTRPAAQRPAPGQHPRARPPSAQYRLCPADKELSEECFQQTPLDFVRDAQAIMWNNGTLYPIKGMFVDDSVCPVVPRGSTWCAAQRAPQLACAQRPSSSSPHGRACCSAPTAACGPAARALPAACAPLRCRAHHLAVLSA